MSFEQAEKVADAVLYEGYVLYPYRASAAKNRLRWQFGVVVPRAYAERGGSEPWAMQTEVLLEPEADPEIDLRIRFLQVQARTIEDASLQPVETLKVGDQTLVTWEEGVEHRFDETSIPLTELLKGERCVPIEIPAWREAESVHGADGTVAGRIVRERWPLSALVKVTAEPFGELVKLRVRLENLDPWEGAGREQALRRSLIGAHTLLAVRGGAFVSLLDPPPEAAAAVASCANQHTWPVLAGEAPGRGVVLSSPIILYDYPAVAPESQGDLCDSTEIDEILTLRVMTLTEDEKREARGTDERARQIIERSDAIPPDVLERLHGAVRKAPSRLSDWESFLNPPGVVPPEEAWIDVGGTRVAKGSRVVLRPSRRADSMDLFLAGREATVAGVYRDVEDVAYVAVTVLEEEIDETAGDGRFFYFYPEEIEPLGTERRPYVAMDIAGPGSRGIGDPGDGSAGHDPLLQDQPHVSRPHTLIAGVGNIFLGDDGFGVEVARRLASMQLPDGVRAADFGIRGIHLAYELLDGYESTILVDATPRGGEPGTVYLIEPDLETLDDAGPSDAHGMDPRTVFAMLKTLGGNPGRVRIVGCEPASTDEEMGLSEPVAAGVEEAVRMILQLIEKEEPVCA